MHQDISPVVVFAYKRYEHTQRVLEALSKNLLAEKTQIFIFCDGAKSEKDKSDVRKTQEMIANFDFSNFADHEVFIQEKNRGLANSIINGVTKIINEYGKIIVVEDDTVTCPDFLTYMNDGLNYFESDKTIGSIGGYRANVALPKDYKYDIVKLSRTSSYCWATWKDRWDFIDWEIKDYNKFKFNVFARRSFGTARSRLLDFQMKGKVDSWAVRFAYSLWKNGCFSILPAETKASNIGYDETGTHFNSQLDKESPFYVKLPENPKKVFFESIPYYKNIDKDYNKIFTTTLIKTFKLAASKIFLKDKK